MFEVLRCSVAFVFMTGSFAEVALCRADGKRPSYILVGAGLVLGVLWLLMTSGFGLPSNGLLLALIMLPIAAACGYLLVRLLAKRPKASNGDLLQRKRRSTGSDPVP